jgi:hypothetical protein
MRRIFAVPMWACFACTVSISWIPFSSQLLSQGTRKFSPFPGQEVARIGDAPSEVLLDPGLVACRNNNIVVFDYGDMSLKTFNMSGRLMWTNGRKGSGPGEFLNPTDLKFDTHDNIVLRDPPNGRIMTLSPAGVTLGATLVASQYHQMLPLNNGQYLLVGASGDNFAIVLDTAGRQMRSLPLTPAQLRIPPISRQTVVGQADDGGSVIGFLYSSGFELVSPAGEIRRFPGVETLPFPEVVTLKIGDKKQYTATRIDPQAAKGSYSAALDARHAYFLFGGHSSPERQFIDVYDRLTGKYETSHNVPAGTASIVACGSAFLVLSQDPAPVIRIYSGFATR